MSSEQSRTTFAGAESGHSYPPFELLDHYVHFAAGLNLDMDQVDRDPHGRLGMRSATPGQPALFRIGQVITLQTGDSTRPQYMGADGYLRDLDPSGTDMPEEVRTRMQWLKEVEEAVAKERNAAGYLLGEVTSVHDEELPPQRSNISVVGGLARVLLRALRLGRTGAERQAPTDTRPPTRGRHRDAFGSRGTHSANRPGQHRR